MSNFHLNPNVPPPPPSGPTFDIRNHAMAQGHAAAHGQEITSGPLYLTADELIIFIEQGLADIDQKIRDQMAVIKAKRDQADNVQRTIARLNACADENGKVWITDDPAATEKWIASLRADADASADPEAAAALNALADELERLNDAYKAAKERTDVAAMATARGTPIDITQTIGDLEAKLSDLTSSTDLDMIRLQKEIEGRQRLVMFVTNTLRAMDESADHVVQNIS